MFKKENPFEQLPAAVYHLQASINELKELLQRREAAPQPEPETLLTVQDAAKFLSLSVPTIYTKISKDELPFIKKSKRVYFSNFELLEYMKTGRKKSKSERERGTDNFLTSKKKGGNVKC